MNRLVLVDGHAILHRAFHALPPLTTSSGKMVNAVFGFTAMLLRVINDLKPTHLVVAFDTPHPTFRNKLYKDYQIHRPKADDEFISQIDLVKKVVREMGIQAFEKPGYEADDVIGTIGHKAFRGNVIPSEARNLSTRSSSHSREIPPRASLGRDDKIDEVIIVTGDRDILQLVDDKTKVYMPVKGLSESKLYGEREVEEKFGVKPSQIIDYKALVGDQSDNYPGVAGVGPKTASSLLTRFKTLEEIYEQVHKVESDKVRKALEEDKESAEMAKKLATIVTNVPLEIDWEKCRLPNYDRPNVHHLFELLEFRSLIPRLSKEIKNQKSKIKSGDKEHKQEENKAEQIQLF